MGVCFNKTRIETNEIENPDYYTFKRTEEAKPSAMPIRRTHPTLPGQPLNTLIDPEFSEDEIQCFTVTERVVIQGIIPRNHQQSFEDKKVKTKGQPITRNQLSYIGVGISCKKGLKPGSPNQDDFCIVLDTNFSLFSVYDGHGEFGHEVSNYVKKTMPDLILSDLFSNEELESNIQEAFKSTNRKLISHCQSFNFDCYNSGTTASVAILMKNQLIVANVGDTRIIFGVRKNGILTAERATTDHKPYLLSEKTRIENSSGLVKQVAKNLPFRIYSQAGQGPGLSVSRAIGDYIAQQIGVISEPEVKSFILDDSIEYLVICSDGVWEFLSDEEVILIIKQFGEHTYKASEYLASLAWNEWIKHWANIVDDITALVVYVPTHKSRLDN